MTTTAGTGNAVILVGLLLALPLLVIVPLRMLAAYKRSLDDLMRRATQPEPPPPPDSRPAAPPLLVTPATSAHLLQRARSRQRRCALVYAVAGACAAASLTLALLGESGARNPVAFLTIFAANLWPVLLSFGDLFHWRRAKWLRAIALYCAVPCLLALLQQVRSSKVGLSGVLLLFLLLNAPASLFYRAISFRRIRQVGPTLLPLSLAIVMGPLVLLNLGMRHFSIALAIADLAIALNLSTLAAIALTIFLAILVMVLAAWLAAILLVALYKFHQISDQSLLLDSLWFIFIGTQAIFLLFTTGDETGSGSAWVYAALPIYLIVARLGLALLLPRRPAATGAPRLLVLRAFALRQRAEAFFQPLAARWRFLGPVSLIAAPDLAGTTIEPSALLEFVSGRLPALFIRSREDFRARLARENPVPDPDGRFRVYDFFCFANTWRHAVSNLIQRSHIILADFRGLSQGSRGGCDWEIQEIARTASIPRCVFLVDSPEDVDHLHAVLAAAPSAQPFNPAAAHILHLKQVGDRELELLLLALTESPVQGVSTPVTGMT